MAFVAQTLTKIRDSKGRIIDLKPKDQQYEHYIRSHDARLCLLKVQVAQADMVTSRDKPGWKRVPSKVKRSPLTRVLYWTWSSTQAGSKASRVCADYPYVDVAIKWLPSCMIMFVLFFIPQSIGGDIHNNGFYDPVRERDRYYSKASRNPCENNPNAQRIAQTENVEEENQGLLLANEESYSESEKFGVPEHDRYLGLMNRPLRPRYLCYLLDNELDKLHPEESYYVGPGDNCDDEYVFVSYTRRAFCVDMQRDPISAARDRNSLLRFAIAATRAAGKRAFWIDFEGIPADASNAHSNNANQAHSDGFNEDVYRICDVLRGAYSMVVISGPPFDDKEGTFDESHERMWLRVWSHRLWVLPELLLAPTERRISLYTQRKSVEPEDTAPQEFTKRDLAATACRDGEEVRQLVDHYAGTILLTPLELVQLALQCLRRRATQSRTNADLAYALKGLLRRRPQTVKDESGFEAFASLSLANDSQRLLERLICTLPPNPDADWSDMRDAWGMQLWDIEPTCQVAGVVDDRTVLLDGAYGASIRWKRLESVAFIKRETAFRFIVRIIVRAVPGLFVTGVFLTATMEGFGGNMPAVSAPPPSSGRFSPPSASPPRQQQDPGLTAFLAVGALILAVACIIILSAPYLLFKIYMGKFWSTQAWFIGIEGPVDDIAKLERSLFGFCENRLTWSSNSSLLSRHRLNEQYQECEPLPPDSRNISDVISKGSDGSGSPTTTPLTSGQQGGGQVGSGGRRQRLFTLIDTYSLTVTQFYAYNPPSTVFVCGQEGGMQRAVLCSYDWRTQTYCRETVLRMKTLVLERMFRVDRFRFAMRRPDAPAPAPVPAPAPAPVQAQAPAQVQVQVQSPARVPVPVRSPPPPPPPANYPQAQAPADYAQPLVNYAPPPAIHGQPPAGYTQLPVNYGQAPTNYGQPPTNYGQPPASYGQPATNYIQRGGTYVQLAANRT